MKNKRLFCQCIFKMLNKTNYATEIIARKDLLYTRVQKCCLQTPFGL